MAVEKTSLWLTRTPDTARYPKLTGDRETDAVVVGAGIAGTTAAYWLSAAGARVVLLDGGHVGTGETGFTTAFLTSSMDTPFSVLRTAFNDAHIRLARATGEEGITLVEETCTKENISCSFQRLDALALKLQDRGEDLALEIDALRAAGGDPEPLNAEAAAKRTGVDGQGGIRIPRQGAFDVRTYLLELAGRIQKRGGEIFEESRMTGLETGDTVTVKTATGNIRTPHVILATGLFPNPYRPQNTLFRAMITYVIALRRTDGKPWRFPNVLAWDVVEPFHYLRFVDEFFMVGGEDRPVKDAGGAGDTPWRSLQTFAEHLESPTAWELTHAWQGQILETSDALPLVGAPPGSDPRVLLCSGFGGNGMTLGSISGKLAADLVTGKRSPDDQPFSFTRGTLQHPGGSRA